MTGDDEPHICSIELAYHRRDGCERGLRGLYGKRGNGRGGSVALRSSVMGFVIGVVLRRVSEGDVAGRGDERKRSTMMTRSSGGSAVVRAENFRKWGNYNWANQNKVLVDRIVWWCEEQNHEVFYV